MLHKTQNYIYSNSHLEIWIKNFEDNSTYHRSRAVFIQILVMLQPPGDTQSVARHCNRCAVSGSVRSGDTRFQKHIPTEGGWLHDMDGLLYYLSSPDSKIRIRLFIPQKLPKHNRMTKLVICLQIKNILSEKVFLQKFYKQLFDCFPACVTWRRRNLKKTKPPMDEVDTRLTHSRGWVLICNVQIWQRHQETSILWYICLYSGGTESFINGPLFIVCQEDQDSYTSATEYPYRQPTIVSHSA